MGKITNIAWTDHTFNIAWGCTKVSEGCAHCYADTWAARCGFNVWGKSAGRRIFGDKHWREPLVWNAAAEKAGVRRKVFCSSMCDVFEDHATVAKERAKLWPLIEVTPWLDWQLLTKRIERVAEFVPPAWMLGGWPRNAWIGTTMENQERAAERAAHLILLPAPVRFVSAEPLLERIDLSCLALTSHRSLDALRGICYFNGEKGAGTKWPHHIDWVIVGGESGPQARPFLLNAAGKILSDCASQDVPVFVKQLGARPWFQWAEAGVGVQEERIELNDPKGSDMSEWPEAYRVQEFPTP